MILGTANSVLFRGPEFGQLLPGIKYCRIGPELGTSDLKLGSTRPSYASPPRRATMTSLARHIVLRSTGPHRNIPLVFRGQLGRHIHESAEKPPVFRWEVRISPGSVFNGQNQSISRTLCNSRVNSLERKSQFGMCIITIFKRIPRLNRNTAILLGSSVRRVVHFLSTHGPRSLIDASIGVSLSTRSRCAQDRGCVIASTLFYGRAKLFIIVFCRLRQVDYSGNGCRWFIGSDHSGVRMCRCELRCLRSYCA